MKAETDENCDGSAITLVDPTPLFLRMIGRAVSGCQLLFLEFISEATFRYDIIS